MPAKIKAPYRGRRNPGLVPCLRAAAEIGRIRRTGVRMFGFPERDVGYPLAPAHRAPTSRPGTPARTRVDTRMQLILQPAIAAV